MNARADFKNILVKKDNYVTIVSINRPKALNALNTELLLELEKVMEELEKDDETRAVIITGEGKAFVAGADISEMRNFNASLGKKFGETGCRVFFKIENLPKPVIAAVNGFALGGGCELALSCDIRLAGENAKFGQPEVGLGITPGFGGTQRLPRIVGPAKAKELIYTANIIDAKEAEKIGLVNRVVSRETLIDEALNLARRISENAPLAINYSKSAINKGIETDINTGMSIENDLFGLCFATVDQEKGMDAFLKKSEPEFRGK